MVDTDYLVVGSGIAGLTFAIKMAERFADRKLVLITKASDEDTNTVHAQGGIAIVSDLETDSFQQHYKDTLIAGDGCCDADIVGMVVSEGPRRLDDLIEWGVAFDRRTNGQFDLGLEGGHSFSRIIHHKDTTGHQILCTLLERVRQLPNITLLDYHFAIDLITGDRSLSPQKTDPVCYGAYVLDQKSGRVGTVRAKATLLATGGIGRVFGHTTNPMVATGDGIAMAYRAGARINDMEFVQFHPTALYAPVQGRSFLISEAVRGFGAYLRNKKGERFMPAVDPRAELAPRDVVSRAIEAELKGSGEPCVYLDATHLDRDAFNAHFPNIHTECLKRNIVISKDWIPVVSAAHYLCGGITVDNKGETDLKNLFAIGECARTGLHGANRLASNSLLEALVFAHNSYAYLAENNIAVPPDDIPQWKGPTAPMDQEKSFIVADNIRRLQKLMGQYVGVVRSHNGLITARNTLSLMHREVGALYKVTQVNTELCELRNMINVANLIIDQALIRDVNKGGHYNVDLKLPLDN